MRIPTKLLLLEVTLKATMLFTDLTLFSSGGMMMTTEDSMQYDESYGAYEEGYDEGAYYQEGGQEAAGAAGMKFRTTTSGLGLSLGSSCKLLSFSSKGIVNKLWVD